MSIIKIQKRDPGFAQIDNRVLADKRLSWKARGILAYLLSKPNNWKVRLEDLVNRSPDGITAVRSAIDELLKLGYAEREQPHNPDGTFAPENYTIHEIPLSGFPHTVESFTDNLTLSNTEFNNTEEQERSLKSFNLPPEIAESMQEASNLLAEEKEEIAMSFGIPVEELSTPPYLPPEISAPPTPGIPEPPAHETDIEYMRRMTKERLAKHGIGGPLPPPSHEAEENRKRGMEAIAKWQEQRRLDLIAMENGGIPVQDIQDIPVIEDYLAKVEEDIRPLARVFCYSHRRPPRDKSEDSYWRKEWWGQRVMGITPEDTTKAIYRMRKGDGKGGNILSIKSPASITAFADEERIKRAE